MVFGGAWSLNRVSFLFLCFLDRVYFSQCLLKIVLGKLNYLNAQLREIDTVCSVPSLCSTFAHCGELLYQ